MKKKENYIEKHIKQENKIKIVFLRKIEIEAELNELLQFKQ